MDGLGGFLAEPKVSILADGNGAEIKADFRNNTVHGFVVPTFQGSGYKNGNAVLTVSPTLRAIKTGTEELLQVYFLGNPTRTEYAIENTFDGTPLNGEGYIIAPSFFPGTVEGEGANRINFDRWPIIDDGNGVGKLDNSINVSNPGIDPSCSDRRVH